MTGQAAENKTKLPCPSDNCQKEYTRKQNLTNHIKSIHQSLVQWVVNYLSPQPPKDKTSMSVLASKRELFTDSEDENADLNEALDDQEVFGVAQRYEEIEALRMPIIPDKDFLTKTLPAGQLSDMLKNVQTQNQTARAPEQSAPQKLTCAECLLGKEVNREQERKHKALEETHKTFVRASEEQHKTTQKLYKKMELELKDTRKVLNIKTKECSDLQNKLGTKPNSKEADQIEIAEVVEEPVKSAGDWQTCDMCTCKFKGITKLLAHQQTAHLTCTMCHDSRKWVGLSLEHLKIHHSSSHGIRSEGQKCKPCKMKFPDTMAKNVHMLKYHSPQLKCTKCDFKCNDKKQFNAHMHENHTEKTAEVKMKCIVCDYEANTKPDLKSIMKTNI